MGGGRVHLIGPMLGWRLSVYYFGFICLSDFDKNTILI